jgi:hypothetical protein
MSHNGRTPTHVLSGLAEAPSLQVNFFVLIVSHQSLHLSSYPITFELILHVNWRKSWIVPRVDRPRFTAQDWQ